MVVIRDTTEISSDSNLKTLFFGAESSLLTETLMKSGRLYFLKESYFEDFPDEKLEKNGEFVNGKFHNRPCFYSFEDNETGLFWMIPFSSKVEKYRRHYENKIRKYKICDTIVFGYVLNEEKAFLIQNMCPTTIDYIDNEYCDKNANIPIVLSGNIQEELIRKSHSVLSQVRHGRNLIFPDVLQIEKQLLGL